MKLQSLKGRLPTSLRQRGEMPIGPVFIIALIVLPLVFLLITYGGQIATSFTAATNSVSGAAGANVNAAGTVIAPPATGQG